KLANIEGPGPVLPTPLSDPPPKSLARRLSRLRVGKAEAAVCQSNAPRGRVKQTPAKRAAAVCGPVGRAAAARRGGCGQTSLASGTAARAAVPPRVPFSFHRLATGRIVAQGIVAQGLMPGRSIAFRVRKRVPARTTGGRGWNGMGCDARR